MRLLSSFALLSLMSISPLLHANSEQGFYAGGNYTLINFSEDAPRISRSDMGTAALVGGYKYRNWAGLEVQLGAGLRAQRAEEPDASAPEETVRQRNEFDGYQGIYYRVELVNQEARLYLLVGYASLDMTSRYYDEDAGVLETRKRSASGTSYGVGVGFKTENNTTINVEYKLLVDTDDVTFGALGLGFDYRF